MTVQKDIKRLHILGICGTFMGGLALIARELGYEVSGTDANVYPPMSTQLEESGIRLFEGYDPAHLDPAPDLVIVGNAMSRGNSMVEYLLDRGIPYTSGPQWLADYVLQDRWVLAVAGTHGKTTTTSMLSWILDDANMNPGFLIGGVAENFGISARLGEHPFFVIEADEYDTAFFDKRSKFVHYRPRTTILNNLEFDHADIFDDLSAIKRQFHHLVRTIPANGLIISPANDENIQDVLAQGCWTPLTQTALDHDQPSGEWRVIPRSADYSEFDIEFAGERQHVSWPLIGEYNARNAVAAVAAARHVGVKPEQAVKALREFKSVKRRLEKRGEVNNISVYDDFAHHPTAIKGTIAALRQHLHVQCAADQSDQQQEGRIISVLEPRSNTMRMGIHHHALAESLADSDYCLLYSPPDLKWDLNTVISALGDHATVFAEIDALVAHVTEIAQAGDQILVMSNGGFAGIHGKLLISLKSK